MGPIGIFDSGVGGLKILTALHKRLPQYDTLYLSDSARAPYGPRTHEELVEFTWQAAERLFAHDCDLMIVACNSASASALREIQQTKLAAYPGKRILGIIRPTVEYLAEAGYINIATLSTEATRKSAAYTHEFHKINPAIQVHSQACPNWAALVEAGKAHSPEAENDVAAEISRLLENAPHTEAVLLACTHYPYLAPFIKKYLPANIQVFNQGDIVADSLANYLLRHPEIENKISQTNTQQYFCTGNPTLAKQIAHDALKINADFQGMNLTFPAR